MERYINEGFRKIGTYNDNGIVITVMAKGNWSNYKSAFNVVTFHGNELFNAFDTNYIEGVIRDCHNRR